MLPKIAKRYQKLPTVIKRIAKVTNSWQKLPKFTQKIIKCYQKLPIFRKICLWNCLSADCIDQNSNITKTLLKVTKSYQMLPKVTQTNQKLPKITK